jgi:hypothetical protein
VPLSTVWVEMSVVKILFGVLLGLVIFPEKRMSEEAPGSKTSEALLVTLPWIDPPDPIQSVPALITVPPV